MPQYPHRQGRPALTPAPRPNLRKTQGLHNLGRGGEREAHYVSHCKICRAGIYRNQTYRWGAKPLGLSHVECLDREPS